MIIAHITHLGINTFYMSMMILQYNDNEDNHLKVSIYKALNLIRIIISNNVKIHPTISFGGEDSLQ